MATDSSSNIATGTAILLAVVTVLAGVGTLVVVDTTFGLFSTDETSESDRLTVDAIYDTVHDGLSPADEHGTNTTEESGPGASAVDSTIPGG